MKDVIILKVAFSPIFSMLIYNVYQSMEKYVGVYIFMNMIFSLPVHSFFKAVTLRLMLFFFEAFATSLRIRRTLLLIFLVK